MKKIIPIILTLIIIAACSNEEPFIDNSKNNVSFIIQRNINTLEVLDFNDVNVTFTNIELEKNIGKIDLIKKFRGYYYLVNKEMKNIFILKNINPPLVNEIDFFSNGLIVNDICFPNATDCYIIYENSAKVGVIDLTTNEITNIEIPLSDIPSSIAGLGNQIYVTIPTKNLVEVIDTRTNNVVSQINISNSPSIVDFNYNGESAIVISKGDANKPAMISIINLETKQITRSNILTGNEQTAINIMPNAMIVGSRYVYVTATNVKHNNGGAFRIASSNYLTTSVLIKNSCNNVIKNYNSALFIEVDENNNEKFVLFNTNDNKKIKELNVGSVFYSACEK